MYWPDVRRGMGKIVEASATTLGKREMIIMCIAEAAKSGGVHIVVIEVRRNVFVCVHVRVCMCVHTSVTQRACFSINAVDSWYGSTFYLALPHIRSGTCAPCCRCTYALYAFTLHTHTHTHMLVIVQWANAYCEVFVCV